MINKSKKEKTFSDVFAAFLKFISKFENFEKKHEPRNFCTSESI